MDGRVIAVAPLALGYALDWWLGDPRWLPHPVVGFGHAIGAGERALNRGAAGVRFFTGSVLCPVTLAQGVGAIFFTKHLGDISSNRVNHRFQIRFMQAFLIRPRSNRMGINQLAVAHLGLIAL